jgi:hypothetical protein
VSSRRPPRDRLARAVRRLAHPPGAARREEPAPPAHDLAGRLDRVERELSELRGRITALFLTVVGVGITELLSRVAG